MCEAKWFFKVLLIGVVVKGCHLITTNESPNGTVTLLWNLTKYAVDQGRGKSVQVESRQRAQPYTPYPYRPYPGGYGFTPPYLGQGSNQEPQSLMNALSSIAANDELHCVPKLLCELTSGSRTSTTEQSSFLPFNINMDSLVGLLSTINGYSGNPILLFGRAALLGLSAGGNSGSCTYAFPRCPTDPDKLVNYLNNYNGGFFRYFNGVPHPSPNYPPNNYQYPNNNYYGGSQQRILTKPTHSISATSSNPYYDENRLNAVIKFPADENYISNEIKDSFYTYKSPKTLTFPAKETSVPSQYHFRDPKTLTFPAEENIVNNVLDFQRPLPNHVALPMIFPTRTGTGELILDSDQFFQDEYYNEPNQIHFHHHHY